MTVRLATEADIPILDTMLSGMGQFWSETAIRESLAAPWITVLHEDGEVDGFYVGLVLLANKQTIIGPGDYLPAHDIVDPDARAKAWMKAICEMGLEIEAELTRRHPTEDPALWWTITRIGTEMGPMRDSIDQAFQFKKRANPNHEGYDILPDGCHAYWQERPHLVNKARLVLEQLA